MNKTLQKLYEARLAGKSLVEVGKMLTPEASAPTVAKIIKQFCKDNNLPESKGAKRGRNKIQYNLKENA